MSNEDYLDQGKFMTLLNYIYFLFVVNLLFLLASLPFSVYLIFFKTVDLKVLSLLWIICGPALIALFMSINKLLKKSDESALKTFFNAYLKNFKHGILISAVQGIILFILQIDMQFFLIKKIYILYYMFITLSILVISISFFIYPIVSRFEASSINLFKLSIFYSIKKVHVLLLNIILSITITYILSRIQVVCLFFNASIVCLLVLINERKVFAEIENTFFNK